MVKAFLLASAFTVIFPAERVFALRRPDGILFFMVYNYFVDRIIGFVLKGH